MVYANQHDRVRAILNAHYFEVDIEFDAVMLKLSEARVSRVEAILTNYPPGVTLLGGVESWQEFDLLEGLTLRLAESDGWTEEALGIEPYLRR
jgi:hypothetical protein